MIDLNKFEKNKKQILVISGLSGAGKTVCFQVLIDFGYVILSGLNQQNYQEIIEPLIEKSTNNKIAFILNIVNEESFNIRYNEMKEIKNKFKEYEFKQIFLKAKSEVLITRYSESRKIHPYSYYNGSGISIAKGIEEEKRISTKFKEESDFVIDTSSTLVAETKKILESYLGEETKFTINIASFGFKYGIDTNSDFVFDLRSLPNPFYIKDLRSKNGTNKEVSDYVFKNAAAQSLYKSVKELLVNTIPGYKEVGKIYIHVAFGCTGGQHRSVSFAQRLGKELGSKYKVNIIHIEGERGHWK